MSNKPQPVSLSAGIIAAFATPVFLGVAPIFGKFAILSGATPFTLAAVRTIVAVVLLWIAYAIFFRKYIFIYPAGLMGCVVIGIVNGIGSLFYYSGLDRLDASMVQIINGMYLVFAVLLSRIGGQKTDIRTTLRVTMAFVGLVMITGLSETGIDWAGVGFMLANAIMFAGTVILSQYVLYEMPAPTAALYILTTMGVVVTMVWLATAPSLDAMVLQQAGGWVVALGISTALSRLAMFASVKFLGGMQTAIMATAEIAVAVILALIFLNETLAMGQWAGVALLVGSILLIRQQDLLPRGFNPNALVIANMSNVQFQRIAFHRAFGTSENDNAENTMGTLTTQEMVAIQRMMGATPGGIDPFPIGKSKLFADLDADIEALAETSSTPNTENKDNTPTSKHSKSQNTVQEINIPEDIAEDDE